jgi:hypothetical protein
VAAITGKAAKVKYTAVAYSTAAAEAFTSLSATTDRFEFKITDATKRHWTRDTPPLILVKTTAHTDMTYNYVQGKLTFTGAPLTTDEGDNVTGTVYWLTASYLPWTRSWSMDVNNDMLETTSFSTSTADAKWRTYLPGLSGASVDLGRIVPSGPATTGYQPVWFDYLNTDQDVILELHMASTYKFEAYARVESDGYTAGIDSLQEESITFRVDSPMYYATTE